MTRVGASPSPVDGVLVGPRLEHNENLGPGDVAAASRQAGLRPVVGAPNAGTDIVPLAGLVRTASRPERGRLLFEHRMGAACSTLERRCSP